MQIALCDYIVSIPEEEDEEVKIITKAFTLQVWKKAPIFDFSPIVPWDMEKRLLVGLSSPVVDADEDCEKPLSVSMVLM